MKLTKLMVLALVLALFVCAFVACGGTTDTETQAPETQAPETQAPESETDASGDDPEAECAHEIVVDEKAATCSDRGYKKETCKLCGEVVSETAYPKTAHTASGAATCDTDSKCTACGEVIEAAKGHVWGEATTTAATCMAAGKETKTCTVCNKTDVKELATLAHVIDKATATVPATCTSAGSKTGVCSLCGLTQTVVLPAQHAFDNLGDLSALTFVEGKIQAKCSTCQQAVDVTGDVRIVLNFDEADVATELAKYGEDFKYVIVYNADQASTATGDRVPVVKNYPDAADGHTSVLATIHNSSPAITFKGELLADADYYVISFDWRATKYGNNTNKIGAFGQAAKAFDGVAGEGDMVYAFKVDRSNGDLYDHSGKNKFGSAPAGQWYKVIVVVDNESGTAYTYVDGVCVATTQNAKWQVVEGGEYTWRFGGIYNVFHVPEFDNFEVVAIQKSVTEVGPSVDGGDEEEGDEEDDGTGCAHQCYLEYQLPTSTTPGFIKRTCLICGRVVTFEVLDHIHTPDEEADCVTDSKCTECGVVIEAAWGHNFDGEPEVIPAVPACSGPGTVVGKCTVCGDVTEKVEPAAHTFTITSVSDLTFADGVFTAKCSACGQEGVVPTEALMTLDFEKSVAAELAAHEDAALYDFAAGVAWGDSNASGAASPELITAGDRSVLHLVANKSQTIKFSGDMLGAASYYVVSFDARFTALKSDKDNEFYGLFGRFALTDNVALEGKVSSMNKSLYAVSGDRGKNLKLSNGNATATVAINQNEWYTVTVVVDNSTGDSTVYVNGTLLGTNKANMLVESGKYYAWVFGGTYNNGHKPQIDNFTVCALDTACLHTNTTAVETAPATCIAPGSANTVCDKCGEILGTEPLPMIDHTPGTVTDDTSMACAYKALCSGCNEEFTFEKEGVGHTFALPSGMNQYNVVGAVVKGTCDVCGMEDVAYAEDVRLMLNFDKADVATELAAYATEENGLAWSDWKGNITNVTVGDRTVMAMATNGAGRGELSFDGSLLADAKVFTISFDWRFTAFHPSGTSEQGVFGVLGSNAMWAAKFNRGTFLLTDSSGASGTHYFTAEQDKWYTVTIVVNNEADRAAVYIDGVCYRLYQNGFYRVNDEAGTYGWKFANEWNTHGPQFDNFKVSVLTKAPVLE